ncbi:MAG TPA: FtsX-like permease family protein [Thermoanaerobaculia bacterium]|nr:FtsX-like permease family protein [Thermoanaerobaculia bacterium]
MLRSLIHFWRLHLAVLLGAAVTATVLTGSLAVGDSMRASLRQLWLERLGNVELALAAPRFFRAELAGEMARRLAGAPPRGTRVAAARKPPGEMQGAAQGPERGVTVAPLIVLRGTAVHASLGRRAARISILGVDHRFAALFPGAPASLWALPGGRGSAVADPPSGLPSGEVADAGGRTVRASPKGRSEGGSATAAADGRPVPAGGRPGSAGLTPVILNQTLARQLGARPGDDVLLSWEQPSAIPRELLLAAKDPEEQLATHRFTVAGVVADRGPGSFDLVPGQATPRNAFLPLAELQRELGEEGKANALLVGRLPPDTGAPAVEAALAAGLRLDDLGLVLRPLYAAASGAPPAAGSTGAASPAAGAAASAGSPRQAGAGLGPAACGLALESREFFLPPAVAASAAAAAAEMGVAARPVLTYLAIALAAHGREVPYSMVSALGTAPRAGPEAGQPRLVDGTAAPALAGDDILLDSWAAEDLAARPGDTVEMSWFLPDSGDAGAPLRTGGAAFRVRGIVALAGLAADRSLTPAFPGIDQARDMASWSPPFPVDLHRVRPRDEAYWHRFGPTPKAFVALAAARRRWRSRFGDLTSVRLECGAVPAGGTVGESGLGEAGSAPLAVAGSASSAAPGLARLTTPGSASVAAPGSPRAGSTSAPLATAASAPPAATGSEQLAARFEPLLLARLRPADFGLALRPVRAEGLRAAAEGTDFSSLFVSFSSFLIVSAALVTGLLFALGLERRAREVGLLLALGYPPRSVRRRFLGEGLALAGAGALLGAACAGAYAAPLLGGLAPALPGVEVSRLAFAISPATLAWGWLASVVTVLVFLVAGVRRMGRLPAARLLAGAVTAGRGERRSRAWRAAALVASTAVLAVLILAAALRAAHGGAPVLAFGVAASLLVAGISAFALWCLAAGERDAARGGLLALGVRNTAANPRRSVLSVGLVASACLVLVLVAANRRDQASGGPRGWGGWNLVAESATPIYQDLGRREGRAALGFSAEAERVLAGSEIAGLAEVPGDDASCLNLYRPLRPRLLGVPPRLARQRFPLAAGDGSLESLFAGAVAKPRPPPEEGSRGSARRQSRRPGREEEASPSQAAAEAEAMPAVGDEQAVRWVLHLGVGDEITVADAAGVPARLRIAGLLAGSPLQGALLVPEQALARHFPRHGGRGVFLVRTPRGREEAVAGLLADQLRDFGLEVAPVAERLRLYSRVEDTYLASFEALGALGLLLGTCGLAVVLLRNVLERRWELAALRAFGFRRRRLAAMLLLENVSLLALGLALGTAAGLLPEALGAGLAGSFPWLPLTATLGAVLLAGLLASGLAVAVAVSAPLLQVLKAER